MAAGGATLRTPEVLGNTGSAASPVRRALWFIEAHLGDALHLDDIASTAGVSRFHLSRTFVAATGTPVVQYVRGRRLTEAARALAEGAPDILSVALDWGYGSHEAFTRAFCSRFGVTPERLRARGHLGGLPLTEVLAVDEVVRVDLPPPCLVQGAARLVAGLRERYTFANHQGIPGLWQRFVPQMDQVSPRPDTCTYGLCCNGADGGFDYVAGVAAASPARMPRGFTRVALPAGTYAVFVHRGHVASIRDTVYTIWNHYLPASPYRPVPAPDFERYTAAFDPRTGNGEVEIWVPVQ